MPNRLQCVGFSWSAVSVARALKVVASCALAMAVLVLGACETRAPDGSSSAGHQPAGTGIGARYESLYEGGGEGGGVPQVLDVIAQGDRFRMVIRDAATPDEVYQTVVWDGSAMLLLEGGDASREEDMPPEQRPTSFIVRAGDATFGQRCPGGTASGSAQVAGRAGTVYSCPAHDESESSEVTLDDATGLLLRTESASGHLTAVEVDTDVPVDARTFSTEIPPDLRGKEDEVAEDGSSLPLTTMESVPLAGGGDLLLDDIRHGPSLVVIGELPGVEAMLARVLPKSAQGSAPPVYVLLNPIPFEESDNSDLSLASEEGTRKLIDQVSAQVATIPVPVGIDIKGGAAGEDLRSFEDVMAGTTVLAAIDEAGALAWRLTDDELVDSAEQVDEWIAANT